MIAIGADHGGYRLKEEIKKYLDEIDMPYTDYGTDSEERTDYPVYAEKVAKAIQSKACDKGILICKTGVGMCIAANKYKGIRCAAAYREETVKQAKEHSDVNVLAIPAQYTNISNAVKFIRIWLGSEFLDGRYKERLRMIEEIEKENMK